MKINLSHFISIFIVFYMIIISTSMISNVIADMHEDDSGLFSLSGNLTTADIDVLMAEQDARYMVDIQASVFLDGSSSGNITVTFNTIEYNLQPGNYWVLNVTSYDCFLIISSHFDASGNWNVIRDFHTPEATGQNEIWYVVYLIAIIGIIWCLVKAVKDWRTVSTK